MEILPSTVDIQLNFILILLVYVIYYLQSFGEITNLLIAFFLSLSGFYILFFVDYLPPFFGLIYFILGTTQLNKILIKLKGDVENDFLKIPDSIIRLYPLIGSSGIIIVFYLNIFYLDDDISSNDYIAILFGIILIFYKTINSFNPFLSNFAKIMFALLSLILVLPRIFILFSTGEIDNSFDKEIVYYFLNLPLGKFLYLLGIPTQSELITLSFYTTDGNLLKVDITRSCSGLHSVAIFISAFVAYNFAEQKKFGIDLFLFSLLGIFVSYLANLFRMLIIILVGIYFGYDELLWTHHNVGWIIFSLWIFLFWKFYIDYNERMDNYSKDGIIKD